MTEKTKQYKVGDKFHFNLTRNTRQDNNKNTDEESFSSDEVRSIYSSNFGEDEIEEEYIEDIDKYVEEREGLTQGSMDFVQKFFMSLKNPDAAKYVAEKITNPHKSDEDIGRDFNISMSNIRKFAANERIASFISDVYARKSSHIINRNIATMSKVSEILSKELDIRVNDLVKNRISAEDLVGRMDANSAKVVMSQRIEGMATKDLLKVMMSSADIQNRASEKIIDRKKGLESSDQAIEKISRKYFESVKNGDTSHLEFNFDSVSITLSNDSKTNNNTTVIDGEEDNEE